MAKAITIGNIDILKILAQKMSPEDFKSVIRGEGDGGPLGSSSILAWAILYNDTELLQIIEQVCPKLVDE